MIRVSFLSVALVGILGAKSLSKGLPSAKPEAVGLSRRELRKIDSQLQTWVDSGKLAGVIAVIAHDPAFDGARDQERLRRLLLDATGRVTLSPPVGSGGLP